MDGNKRDYMQEIFMPPAEPKAIGASKLPKHHR